MIGLTHLTGRPAPAISLQDQNGRSWTLADAAGKVVVLTFFNAECNDICPVLAQEILQADRLLGSRRADVDFVVVNSDPLETSLAPPLRPSPGRASPGSRTSRFSMDRSPASTRSGSSTG